MNITEFGMFFFALTTMAFCVLWIRECTERMFEKKAYDEIMDDYDRELARWRPVRDAKGRFR